jgi:hypothetical protein
MNDKKATTDSADGTDRELPESTDYTDYTDVNYSFWFLVTSF